MLLRRFFLFAAVTLALLAPVSASADNQQGAACSPNGIVSGATKNGTADDGNNLVCVSGTWQYPTTVLTSVAAAAGTSCSSYPTGAIRFNSTLANLEFCNGTTWGQIPAAATSCSAPSGLSFTNLTDRSLNTVVTSNTPTITFSGCSGSYAVTVSGAATAQISINGGTWTTSGAISSGQTLQVRMTTSGTASTTLTATVTVGSVSANWTTTTLSGSLKIFRTNSKYIGGAIGGLSGADALCQSQANTLSYAGTYKAILSDETTDAKDRLTLTYPIVRASDGVTIASTNLWIGSVSNQIGTYGSAVFTGTKIDGTKYAGSTCTSWTSTSGSAECGEDARTDTYWVSTCNYGGKKVCTEAGYLYCIQQ